LVLAGGPNLDAALGNIRKGGRIAYPNGVEPEPKGPRGVKVIPYDGLPNPEILDRLNVLIETEPFRVEIGRSYSLDEMDQALLDVQKHHLGKLALRLPQQDVVQGRISRSK
jgi:NADPH:quinone reductase-like Zn-dependent oxidoreductase